jgi:hypothetical protein
VYNPNLDIPGFFFHVFSKWASSGSCMTTWNDLEPPLPDLGYLYWSPHAIVSHQYCLTPGQSFKTWGSETWSLYGDVLSVGLWLHRSLSRLPPSYGGLFQIIVIHRKSDESDQHLELNTTPTEGQIAGWLWVLSREWWERVGVDSTLRLSWTIRDFTQGTHSWIRSVVLREDAVLSVLLISRSCYSGVEKTT